MDAIVLVTSVLLSSGATKGEINKNKKNKSEILMKGEAGGVGM